MHILFLTDNFPPEVNAPASRTHEHCREWVAKGARVTVITCAPNFPQGHVYPGYKNKIWQKEIIDGILVIRVWSYIAPNDGVVLRTIDYLSFMFGATLAGVFQSRVDVIVGTSPQFFTPCAAFMVAMIRRKPWVFELRDIWPESISSVGAMKEGFALRMLEKLELFLYRKATTIVSLTQSFRLNLIERGVQPDKIEVVTNGVNLALYQPGNAKRDLRAHYNLNGKFIVGYVGTLGMAHSLETLLEAAWLIQASGDDPDIHFVFLGDGAQKPHLMRVAAQKALENVTFLDPVSKLDVVDHWAMLSVSVIHLRKTPLFEGVIPSKLFECMAMGVPIIHCVMGESADLVQKCGAGITLEPENPEFLRDTIRKLRNEQALASRLGLAGLEASRAFDRRVLAENMLLYLDNAVRRAA